MSDGTVAGTSLLMPPSEKNIHPRRFTVFKDALYFITVNGKDYENKLHKTDGTVAGTVPIELKHSEYVLSPYSFVAYGDYPYMGAGDRNTSFVAELYRYDGVHTQCDKLEGEPGATGDSHPSSFFVHGSDLYFTAYLNATGEELYQEAVILFHLLLQIQNLVQHMYLQYIQIRLLIRFQLRVLKK